MTKKRIREFIKKGKLPINAIDEEYRKENNIKIGMVTPFTKLKIVRSVK